MQVDYPKTYNFLHHFYNELRGRSRFRNFDPDSGEFYELYNVGAYTFQPYKVVWREQFSGLACAVVSQWDGKLVIPDHKLMLIPLVNLEEANYLCACMNSSPANFIVKSYSIEIQISTHVLRYLRIPKYDPANSIHKHLSTLSQQAHSAIIDGNIDHIKSIEAEIDRYTMKLWDLTDSELKEIQDSLMELH
jgi:hypothetical protein